MALQGDLQSFALPDVLRLLAGTSKTGRLAVSADDRTGDVWLKDGVIVAGAVSSSPYALDAADVVFELLRFESGSFAFEDGEEPAEAGSTAAVDDAIGRAEELVREWHEVEAVVPSVQSWITLVPEIQGETATVRADHWRLLAIVAGGCTVRDLGDRFSQTDLASSRQVKELVEAGLVELGDPPADWPASAAPAAPMEDVPPSADHDDLSVLRADDGPVVLESSEDALLPEPLPGEGTSFEGDLTDLAPVDRRYATTAPQADAVGDGTFGDHDFGDREPGGHDAPTSDDTSSWADEGGSWASEPTAAEPEPFVAEEYAAPEVASYAHEQPVPAPEPEAEVAAAPPAGDGDPFADTGDPFGSDDFFGAAPDGRPDQEVVDDPLDSTPSTDAASAEAVEGAEGDDSRGALLNFLSTVKR